MSMPGWKELLIILLIVLIVFGASRVRRLGSDLGGALRGFRNAAKDAEDIKNSGDDRKSSAG